MVLCFRRGGEVITRVPTEPRAGAEHRGALLPDHLPGATAPPREDGHLHQGDRGA